MLSCSLKIIFLATSMLDGQNDLYPLWPLMALTQCLMSTVHVLIAERLVSNFGYVVVIVNNTVPSLSATVNYLYQESIVLTQVIMLKHGDVGS